MSVDIPPVEWRTVDRGHRNSERDDFRATFKHGCRARKRFDLPHRSADHVRRRIRRIATEHNFTDLGGTRWTADFRLVDGPNPAPFRSAVVFWEYADGPVDVQAFSIRLPPDIVPEAPHDIDDMTERKAYLTIHREAVKAVAEPLAALRPPVAGCYAFVTPQGYPHLRYGQPTQPHRNKNHFPAEALLTFLTDLKPVVERVLDGKEWAAE